jgi:hypothetical protein
MVKSLERLSHLVTIAPLTIISDLEVAALKEVVLCPQNQKMLANFQKLILIDLIPIDLKITTQPEIP